MAPHNRFSRILLGMQILRPYLVNQKPWAWGPVTCVLLARPAVLMDRTEYGLEATAFKTTPCISLLERWMLAVQSVWMGCVCVMSETKWTFSYRLWISVQVFAHIPFLPQIVPSISMSRVSPETCLSRSLWNFKIVTSSAVHCLLFTSHLPEKSSCLLVTPFSLLLYVPFHFSAIIRERGDKCVCLSHRFEMIADTF